jgi:hypothetical protein
MATSIFAALRTQLKGAQKIPQNTEMIYAAGGGTAIAESRVEQRYHGSLH